MAVRIELEPRAVEEMQAAYHWYLERSPHAAAQFESAIDLGIEALAEAPERWPIFDGEQLRRYRIHRFPYSLLYTFDSSSQRILIVAVAHQRRRPGYWRDE